MTDFKIGPSEINHKAKNYEELSDDNSMNRYAFHFFCLKPRLVNFTSFVFLQINPTILTGYFRDSLGRDTLTLEISRNVADTIFTRKLYNLRGQLVRTTKGKRFQFDNISLNDN